MEQAPSGAKTVYVRDGDGEVVVEYGSSAGEAAGIQWMTPDHLGSVRAVTGAGGTVVARRDYLPFGEEIPLGVGGRGALWSAALNGRTRFAGKDRDGETDLDYSGARYFSGAQGRFTSPDEALVDQDPADPQSWNLYGYVRNNPLTFVDPTGRCMKGADGKYHDSDEGSCVEAGGTSVTVREKAPKERDAAAEASAAMMRMQYEGWRRDQERNKPKEDQPIHGIQGQGSQVLRAAGERATHDMACTGLGLAVGDLGGGLFAVGRPTIDKPFSQGGMKQTSVASEAFRVITKGARGGIRLPTLVGGPGTGMPVNLRMTNVVGAFWGRW